jgi:hypothetical protein
LPSPMNFLPRHTFNARTLRSVNGLPMPGDHGGSWRKKWTNEQSGSACAPMKSGKG